MRIVAEIPHSHFKITLHSYNAKYILKIEIGQFEQLFKMGETDVTNSEQIKEMLTEEFLESCMQRFLSMREDFTKAFNSIK